MLANVKLSPEQIQTLRREGENFKIWINEEEGKKKVKEHKDHERYFKEKLSPENLAKITENEFSELWQKSWASGVWGNKEWNVKNRLIAPNGIDTIRRELHRLLYGEGDIAGKYDRFRKAVKGFGMATLSEFLSMAFPDKFCVWNEKPKGALPFLKLDLLPVTTGEQYFECINYLTLIRNELSEFGIRDFADLDVFFWHIFDDVIPAGPPETLGPSLWLVRAGSKGQDEHIALEKNLVGIGYGGLKGLDSITDKDTFKKQYIALHPDGAARANRVVPQIWNFINNIKIGDLVLLPQLKRNGKIIAVGKIVSNYKDQEISSELSQFRQVEWLKKDVPRDEFDNDIEQSLSYRGTVHYLGGSNLVDKVKAMLEKMGSANYWIFVVTDKSDKLTAEQIHQTRMRDKFWGLNEGTAHRTDLRKGDKVIFSSGAKTFLGTSLLDSDSFKLDDQQKIKFSHDIELYKPDYGVLLSNIVTWDKPKEIKGFAGSLSFITKPDQYGVYFQGGVKKITPSDYNIILTGSEAGIPSTDEHYSIQNLVNDTFINSEVFEEWIKMLDRKKQMILIGPPGTGKTFVAKAFARYLLSGSGINFKLVQFHPSYSYEDFLEGIKPKLEGNNITYEVVAGKLKNICEEATVPENRDKKFVLIIDEINRGQTSRIFGELIHALEYRDDPIPLLYSNEDFKIPKNLILIGTMNSTDRSIAFLDYAIRRRFWFYKLEPSEIILTKYFQKNIPTIPYKHVVSLFSGLNSIIEEYLDEEFKIGHSYFMLENLDIKKLEMIWHYEIKPLLKEYFFNDKSKLIRCQELFDKIEIEIGSTDQSESAESNPQSVDSSDVNSLSPTNTAKLN